MLAVVGAYPHYFGNLQWVWLGVVSHYVLDVLGTTRGLALFYPLWSRECDLPLGLPSESRYTDLLTMFITVGELAGVFVVVHSGHWVVETQ